ncbi:hypothetical protein [Nostoc sp. MG11]|uniref:hypothetical protein n=1 Tax=Nostoc sp. MG11 TaxID=2721166 RepID=UPI0018673C73|nr:hypothetical protein [Nostoc sp. MG11]
MTQEISELGFFGNTLARTNSSDGRWFRKQKRLLVSFDNCKAVAQKNFYLNSLYSTPKIKTSSHFDDEVNN